MTGAGAPVRGKHINPRATRVELWLTPAQWIELHHVAGVPYQADRRYRRANAQTIGVLSRRRLIAIDGSDWAVTALGREYIEKLQAQREQARRDLIRAGLGG